MESVASLDQWDADLIPGLAQWVEDPALLQLWCGLQLQLRTDPWPGNSICHRAAKKGGGKKLKQNHRTHHLIEQSVMMEMFYICTILYGSHQHHVSIELLKCGSTTEKLNFKLN